MPVLQHRLIAIAAALLLALGVSFVAPTAEAGREPTISILLLGNSLVRGVKGPLKKMLVERGEVVQMKAHGPGIWDLRKHAESPRTEKIITARPWDVVMLQEKSTGLSEDQGGYAAVRILEDIITENGSETCMFMTWRERDFDPATPGGDFMWQLLHGQPGDEVGYVPIAFELDVPVVPVGWGIRQARLLNPSVELYKGGKGRHLGDLGRYLGASVAYAAVTGDSPLGAWAPNRIDPATAQFLQLVAEQIVLGNPGEWNLGSSGGFGGSTNDSD